MITQINRFSLYNPNTMRGENSGRVLAVDWGGKRIGLALSDPTRSIARPLEPFLHISRQADAEKILRIAEEHHTTEILMGVTYDDQGALTPSGRSAARLAEIIRQHTGIPVNIFDESESSKEAHVMRVEAAVPKGKRRLPVDSQSAAIFLQRYLDTMKIKANEND